MKKFIVALTAAVCSFSSTLLAQDANTDTNPIPLVGGTSFHVVSRTNVVSRVAPITISSQQFDAIVSSLQFSGVTADIQLSSANIQAVYVRRTVTGSGTNFVVSVVLTQ